MSVQITNRDFEQFSAYLDGQLAPSDQNRLEARLNADPKLRAALDELAATRTLLRKAKRLRAPRNFTLSPETARQYARKPLFLALPPLPAFRFSAALSALSLIAVLGLEIFGLLPQYASNSTALAPAIPMAGSERYAIEPTMGIQWQPGPLPATDSNGNLINQQDIQPKFATGMGGGGDNSGAASPIQGQVEIPQIAIQGLEDQNQSTATPQAPGATTANKASSPILGVPASGDGGKMIDSNGNLSEIPTSSLAQPAPEQSSEPISTRRIVEIGLISFAVLAGLLALFFRRSAA